MTVTGIEIQWGLESLSEKQKESKWLYLKKLSTNTNIEHSLFSQMEEYFLGVEVERNLHNKINADNTCFSFN